MTGVPCKDCPPLERLWQQFVDGGGELWLCPICVNARDLNDAEKVPNAKIMGATPVWEWAGNDTTVFSYDSRSPGVVRKHPAVDDEVRASHPASGREGEEENGVRDVRRLVGARAAQLHAIAPPQPHSPRRAGDDARRLRRLIRVRRA